MFEATFSSFDLIFNFSKSNLACDIMAENIDKKYYACLVIMIFLIFKLCVCTNHVDEMITLRRDFVYRCLRTVIKCLIYHSSKATVNLTNGLSVLIDMLFIYF